MILVVLTFFVGANVEKLICEPYANKQLLQVNMVFFLGGRLGQTLGSYCVLHSLWLAPSEKR